MVEDRANAADDRGRKRDDHVAADGEIVRAAGSKIEDRGDARLARDLAEFAEFLGHQVARGDASAWAMNPHDDSDDARVARRGFEFFVEGSDRILARRVESGEVLIEEEAVDVDHRDPRRMSPRGPGAKDDGNNRPGIMAHRRFDLDRSLNPRRDGTIGVQVSGDRDRVTARIDRGHEDPQAYDDEPPADAIGSRRTGAALRHRDETPATD